MADYQRVIEKLRFRIGLFLALRTAVTVLSVWLLAWGLTVLTLRGAFSVPYGPLLLWGMAGVVVAIATGIVVAVRSAPPESTIRAMLDNHWQCGGLLMTTAEMKNENWPITIPVTPQPKISWNGGKQLGILLCCATFLVASFLVPARVMGTFQSERLIVDSEVKKVAEKIELLKEEKILPPERAESLEQALERLKQEAVGNDPAKTWEALDHLEDAIAKAGAEAAELASREARKAAGAEELAAALDLAKNQMAPLDLKEAMELLARNVKAAAEENALLSEELTEELLEQLKKGELSPEQLKELAQKLGNCKACDLGTLKKLADAKLIDPSMLKKLEGECEGNPKELAELLAQCRDAKSLKELLAQCQMPGRGGVTRGRGDAAMTWTDGSNTDDVKFKEKVLPPGGFTSLKESQLLGLSTADPTAKEPVSTTSGGALSTDNAGRGSARTQVILPEHKKVIQRYFERD